VGDCQFVADELSRDLPQEEQVLLVTPVQGKGVQIDAVFLE
jgi:hypothetical protein